ncbi:MAG: PilZ domain-containing protein [Acidobacteria bacterium]|nr:PilZ domain-containing protein [Acidobacteriota bacterium]
MIRDLVSKLTGLMAETSHSARKKHSLPIKVTFEPLVSTGKLMSPTEKLFITGETSDLSRTGVGFIVSSIRVRENYLVGQDRRLTAEIDLPGGKIRMKIIGRRYEKVGIHLSTERFLIGAEIVEISDADRERYDHFLKFGKRKKATSPSLEMGGN